MNTIVLNKDKGHKSNINVSTILDLVKFLVLTGILFWLIAI